MTVSNFVPTTEALSPVGKHDIRSSQRGVRPAHIKTPLVLSAPLSKLTGHNVYLKLDNLQPSGSFKMRGIGAAIQAARERVGPSLHVVSSSGGNAGIAACTASRLAGVQCTLYCPDSTPDHIVELCIAEGAEVVREGKAWDDANANAEATVAKDPKRAVLVHPFVGDALVAGHTSIVDEIYDQLADEHGIYAGPDVIGSAVGGGGLLNGILTGLERRLHQSRAAGTPLPEPTMLVSQCFGADSFTKSLHQGNGIPVTLEAITSKATSMGAKTCSVEALNMALKYPDVRTVLVDDALAASATWRFARDHRLVVEIACGAALAPLYFPERLLEPLFASRQTASSSNSAAKKNICIVVCGGSKDTLQDLCGYQRAEETLDLDSIRAEIDGVAV